MVVGGGGGWEAFTIWCHILIKAAKGSFSV